MTKFDGFSDANFSPTSDQLAAEQGDFVYVLFCAIGNRQYPFYGGQTGRLLGRLNEYALANFNASTDVRVGVAIKRFRQKGFS